ncbi:MAG: hypothetical protein ACYTAO_24395 [Planctomycetota bacterium]
MVVGGTKAQAVDLGKELDKLGVINRVTDPALTAFDKLREKWNQFKASVGEKILDKLAEGGLKLLDWLTKNESKVVSLTEKFTDFINAGLQKLIDWLDSDGPGRLIATFKELAATIQGIYQDLQPIIQGIGKVSQALGGAGRTISGGRSAFEHGAASATVGMGVRAFQSARSAIGPDRFNRMVKGVTGGAANLVNQFEGAITGQNRQEVHVTVGVDPNNGSVKPYVDREIGRNNAELVSAGGGANTRAIAGGGSLR